MNTGERKQQVELLIAEYLQATGCTKTLDQFCTSDFETISKSDTGFQALQKLNQQLDKPYSSVIELMLAKQLEKKNDDNTASEWSTEEISKLKRAIKACPDSMEKSERWKQIALQLDTGRSKRECYEKYKELKLAKKARAESNDSTTTVDDDRGEKSSRVAVQDATLASADVKEDDSKRQQQHSDEGVVEMIVEDVEDDEEGLVAPVHSMPVQYTSRGGPSSTSSSPAAIKLPTTAQAVTLDQAKQVRRLLFGDTKKCFNKDWMTQGFFFSDLDGLRYGLVQSEGGPCGVLAAVQGFVLRYLMYGGAGGSTTASSSSLHPSKEDTRKALLNALSHMIWNCGDKNTCVVALHGRTGAAFESCAGYRPDGVTERLHLHTLSSQVDVKTLIHAHMDQFNNPKGAGVVLFVYSAIFSRTIAAIQSDMDAVAETTPTLIGAHSYCTQEMVNLLLTGRAVSNVFDGTRSLGDEMELHGILEKNSIGFLTLFEAYDYMTVGSYLKQPMYPIWVVCSESHYSILFSTEPVQEDDEKRTTFELQYYDGLARQEEPIQLTIHLGTETTRDIEDDKSGLVPPLNRVIRTKWPRASSIDWNGTDPIL